MSSPAAVAAAAAAAPRPLLVAVDVDGTLSPIVAHPADAVLLPGAREALARVVAAPDVTVVVVSGRPLQELREQFGFDAGTRLIGSHGLQDSAVATAELSLEEQACLDAARAELSTVGAGVAGAWVEDKPLSAVLHVAQAERAVGDALLAEADARLRDRPGLWLIPGRRVLEATVRPASKRPAVERLRAETGAAAVVYLGDDVTDEAVLEALRPPDVGVRVGALPSVAPYRLAGPAEVVAMLDELALLVSR